jgi:hypothetical protein
MLGDAQHHLAEKMGIALACRETKRHMLCILLIQQASVLHFFSLEVTKSSFVTDFTICQVSYLCLIGFNPLLLRPTLMFRMSRLIWLLQSVVSMQIPTFFFCSLVSKILVATGSILPEYST